MVRGFRTRALIVRIARRGLEHLRTKLDMAFGLAQKIRELLLQFGMFELAQGLFIKFHPTLFHCEHLGQKIFQPFLAHGHLPFPLGCSGGRALTSAITMFRCHLTYSVKTLLPRSVRIDCAYGKQKRSNGRAHYMPLFFKSLAALPNTTAPHGV